MWYELCSCQNAEIGVAINVAALFFSLLCLWRRGWLILIRQKYSGRAVVSSYKHTPRAFLVDFLSQNKPKRLAIIPLRVTLEIIKVLFS